MTTITLQNKPCIKEVAIDGTLLKFAITPSEISVTLIKKGSTAQRKLNMAPQQGGSMVDRIIDATERLNGASDHFFGK